MRRTTRIAVWSATHPWRALALWAVVVLATLALGATVAPRQATQLDLGVGQSGHAAQLAAAAGHVTPAGENILISATSGALPTQEARAAAVAVRSALQKLSEVASVSAPALAGDRSAVLVQARMSGDPDTADERVTPLQDVTAAVQKDYPALRVEEVGDASISQQFHQWLNKDLARATSLSLPVTLLILLVAFGAIVMAGIPVVLAISSVASALGLWALASQLVPDPGMVLHIIVLVGMAVGVDYSLFYLRRYREERHLGRGNVDAIQIAAATAGHSVIVSGTAVVLAMAGLYLAQDTVFTAMATGAILVVMVALASSVTVLPALLAKLGRFADRPRVPLLGRLTTGSRPRVVPALVRPVLAHPKLALVLSLAILAGLSVPMLGMSLKATQVEDFPRSLPTMRSYDRLVAAFPDNSTADMVSVRVPSGESAALQDQLTALRGAIAGHADLFGATDRAWTAPDGRTAVLSVAVPHAVDSAQGRRSVALLREELVPSTVGSVPGADAAVGGDIAGDLDYTANLDRSLPLVVGAVMALTFLMMYLTYQSVAIASITVVLNLLSMGASFGLLTLVFQGTWAQQYLGFTSTGHVVSWVPMLLFVVLSGLSLDYHVFVVSRIRENAVRGMQPHVAVRDGIVRTAGVVTSAAVVMVGVFSIFGALSFIELKQIGVGLAAGILIDASLIRIVALPAAMLTLKNVLWWPGRRSTVRRVPAERAVREPVTADSR